ncbi:MAG: hypothetical protein LBD45_03030, partial [Bacteroidales bacterium]|nr:hypothetical protein [Bacteroidales bacterium]
MKIKQVIALLPENYRRRGLWVTASVVLRALLNFAGLTALIPLLILVIDPQGIKNYQALEKIYLLLNIQYHSLFFTVLCVLVLIVIVLKNLISIRIGAFQVKYVNSLFCHFSEKLYNAYFKRGLFFIKNEHTTSMAHKINGVCYVFAHSVLSLFFTVSGETVLLMF